MKKIAQLPLVLLPGLLVLWSQIGSTVTFTGKELLGRVTANSVTVNVAADKDLEVYFEYGATSGAYTSQTATTKYPGGTPVNAVIDRLQPNTRYFYRMRYRETGASAFTASAEHSFRTQRTRGSTFSFAIQADPHMDENSDADVYKLTLQNELASGPDFLIDVGDTFMSDKLQPITQQAIMDRVLLLRSFYDVTCHSVPLFLGLGNHEGEWGRNLTANGQNVAIWDTLARKQYFPNPVPDSFFSGDTQSFPLTGQRQAYYAWEWGDALFVMLDPFWNQPVAPEASGDWSLTLGHTQYDWLKKTLETSTATYKFVFSHNLVGGLDLNGPMRGGIETAKYLEWGGYNLDGTWGFDKARPGWPMPIHQLLVANNVTAYFHGHDHLYAKQDLDGIVYQEGPQPSAKNFNLGTRGTDYNYTHGTILGGAGFIRVRVSPAEVTAEYIETWIPANENATRKNGMVADAYTIPARRTTLKAVSAASYSGGAVAPDSIVAIYGDALTNSPVLVTDSAGAERKAEVLGAASTQVNFVVPSGTAAGRASVAIGGATGDILVVPVAPGLFSANADGKGVAAAVALHVKADGSQTSELVFRCGAAPGSCAGAPLDLGAATEQVYLSLYGTGIRNRSGLQDVTATIGGQKADVEYAGPQPAFSGLDQVNLPIPRSLAGKGEVPVILTIAGRNANTVTVNIK
jgi:uncharacterized protein (TIGR03437 family)